MEASNKLAEESHASSKSMEGMTKSMQDIAVETKQETVSMRYVKLSNFIEHCEDTSSAWITIPPFKLEMEPIFSRG